MEMDTYIDPIIFGDNQFFGINHMSESKAQALDEKFRDMRAISEVIDVVYNIGIKAFMLNTHERALDICNHFRSNPGRYPDLCLYPSMPYAHKYANAVAEKGIFGALKDLIFSYSSTKDIFNLLTKGGRIIFDRDIVKIMKILIDIEMKIFRDLNVRVIFLQNIVTDLFLGFGVKAAFKEFTSYIREKYKVEPGFITLNMPRLVDFLIECEIENPIVCSAINCAGYFMNPDAESYEKTIKEKRFRPIAMSIFASGAVRPDTAINYVCQRLKIKTIVFGASSKNHIFETKQLIEKHQTNFYIEEGKSLSKPTN
jgi:hypothetical protein